MEALDKVVCLLQEAGKARQLQRTNVRTSEWCTVGRWAGACRLAGGLTVGVLPFREQF